MRRSRLLRASSSKTICSLCACRIPQGTAHFQQNGFHSTATSAQNQGSQYGSTPDVAGWDMPDETSEARNALLEMRRARQESEAAEKKREQELADALEARKIFGDQFNPSKRADQKQKKEEVHPAKQVQQAQESPRQQGKETQRSELPRTLRVENNKQPQAPSTRPAQRTQQLHEPEPVQAKQTQPPKSRPTQSEQKQSPQPPQQHRELRIRGLSAGKPPADSSGNSPLNRVQAGKREARARSPRLHRSRMQEQIMAAVQKNGKTASMPNLETTKPEPKIQPPSWMQAAPSSEASEQAPPEATRPVEPRQFVLEDQDADLFDSEFEVTRQAIAQSQAETNTQLSDQKPRDTTRVNRPSAIPDARVGKQSRQLSQPGQTKEFAGSRRLDIHRSDQPSHHETHSASENENPFTQLASSLKNKPQKRESRTSDPFSPHATINPAPKSPVNSEPESRTSEATAPQVVPEPALDADMGDLNEEEEKLLQALLARRRKLSSATAPPQPVPSQSAQSQVARYQPVQPAPVQPSSINSNFDSVFEDSDGIARETLASASRRRAKEEQARKNEEEALRQQNDSRPRFKISFGNGTPWQDEVDTSSDWKHLNSRHKQRSQQNNRDSSPAPLSAEGIDARFEEHRRRRPRYSVFDINNVGYEDKDYTARRRPDQTCVRCGEPGHFFANCPNPARPGWVDRNARNNGSTAQNSRDVASESRNTRSEQTTTRSLKLEEEDNDESLGETQDAATLEALEKEQARNARRSARFAGEDEEEVDEVKPATKARRGRSGEEDEDDKPRKGRRSRFDEEDEFQAGFEGLREARAERKKVRQSKKEKAAKEAARQAARKARKAEEMTPINLPEFVTVSKLAQALSVRYEDFVEKMKELGFENTSHDEVITSENATLIAMEYNFDPTTGNAEEAEAEERDLKPRPEPEDKEFLPTRPPVVAIMGHVDHGKTTILDYLRKSSIAATEHGGITQHIGAFSVALSSGKTITFLDTPGHAAFLEMRKRGATVTDIIILVVAADDSVKPQTIEAIKHAKAANVPIIVAVNKIDKEEANVERVKQDLARFEVEIEDFGGDTQVVPVSGKTGQGIDELEDAAVTLSEILDHRADTEGPVEGWVLEATTKKAGRVATVLVRRGTLKPGSIIVAGKTWARVRTLRNEAGVTEMSAGPGTPIEVDGWRDQPNAGDEVLQAPNEQKAADVVAYRDELEERIKMADDMEKINVQRRAEQEKRILDKEAAAASKAAAAAEDEDGNVREKPVGLSDTEESLGHQTVPFIIKADVSGSVEAVTTYLLQMSNPLCSPTVLRSGVGPVSEFDIEHADAAGGHIISFNLPPDPDSMGRATRKGIKLLEQNVIYRIVDDVRTVLEDRLPAVKTQRVTGEAEVAMAFEIGVGGRKKLRIAGLKVRNGVVGRGSRVRVTRGETRVYDGTVTSLKNVKKDVQEMRKGTECGMGFDGWEEFQVGDMIQTFEEKSEKRTLQI